MQLIIKQERVVTVATSTFTPPEWMQFAFKGERINAIKALREISGRSDRRWDVTVGRYIDGGWRIGLKEAKDIVETVTNGIVITNAAV